MLYTFQKKDSNQECHEHNHAQVTYPVLIGSKMPSFASKLQDGTIEGLKK